MIRLKPVYNVKELKVGDVLLHSLPSSSCTIGRVDCIEGDNLFIISPEKQLILRGNKGSYHIDTLENLSLNGQVLKIYEDNNDNSI